MVARRPQEHERQVGTVARHGPPVPAWSGPQTGKGGNRSHKEGTVPQKGWHMAGRHVQREVNPEAARQSLMNLARSR